MTLLLALLALAGDWADLTSSTLQLLRQGDYRGAEKVARQALEQADNDRERAIAQIHLGRVYRDWLKCGPAARATERGVQLFHRQGEPLLAMESAAQLIALYLECGELGRALAVEKRWMDYPLARRELPPERASYLLGNSAVMLVAKRKYREAEPLIREAIAVAPAVDRATLESTLAVVLLQLRRPEEALEAALRAVRLMKQELGAGHPLAVRPLANLAAIHSRLGHDEEATRSFEEAMVLLRRHYGEASPLTVEVLLSRAHALRREKSEKRSQASGAIRPRHSAAVHREQPPPLGQRARSRSALAELCQIGLLVEADQQRAAPAQRGRAKIAGGPQQQVHCRGRLGLPQIHALHLLAFGHVEQVNIFQQGQRLVPAQPLLLGVHLFVDGGAGARKKTPAPCRSWFSQGDDSSNRCEA